MGLTMARRKIGLATLCQRAGPALPRGGHLLPVPVGGEPKRQSVLRVGILGLEASARPSAGYAAMVARSTAQARLRACPCRMMRALHSDARRRSHPTPTGECSDATEAVS